ncbi:MAG: NADH-dependent [FeFe] hydrogenase, group A6 [Bacteroidales bacterium]|nr:NADH-dependent [FeFe] hydrogenase, group A6 [Bacteroidales bacterium]
MNTINLTINKKAVQVKEGTTIFEAARLFNIKIPHLCYLENVHQFGSCRMCVVEVEGMRNLMASCVTEAKEGMVINTNTERVRQVRKVLYELILSDHPKECLSCWRNQNCELQDLGNTIQVSDHRFEGERSKEFVDLSSPSIVRDSSKCILCRRCVTTCNQVQGLGLMNPHKRGFSTFIGPSDDELLGESVCTNCGQCVLVCPVGTLKEKNSTDVVWEALNDKSKTVVVQTAPAVRAALGEVFGYEPGTLVTGKMAAALHEMGFDYVFDTNFGADLTIMEEGTEFLERVKARFGPETIKAKQKDGAERLVKNGRDESLPKNGKHEAVFPMITSCSPGWIKYIEHQYSDLLPHLSSCKSPHMMLGALAKSYFAEKMGIDPKDMVVVSIMPCTAKKFEIVRPEMYNNGLPNVDAVLTTRELGRMIKDAGIVFEELPEGKFDSPLGLSSGAADIFGTTGGVMEAALRTVYELVTGRELPTEKLHVQPLVGLDKIKTAELKIERPLPEYAYLDNVVLKVAVTSGLSGAGILMEELAAGRSPYHFIEVMGCPGGCISGGGQPRPVNDAVRRARLQAIYREDEGKILRKSHENPDILNLYKVFLSAPLGHLSHELLHTNYTVRSKY